jgi:hypothetical protein
MSGVFQNINPHPLTARAASVYSPPTPPLVRGEDTLAGWRGCGGADTALYSTYVSTLCILYIFGGRIRSNEAEMDGEGRAAPRLR